MSIQDHYLLFLTATWATVKLRIKLSHYQLAI